MFPGERSGISSLFEVLGPAIARSPERAVAAAGGGEGGAQLGQELVKDINRQAGRGPEDGGMVVEMFAAQDRDGLKGSCQTVPIQLG